MNNDSTIKKLALAEHRQDQEVCFTDLETQCVLQFIQNKFPDNIGENLGLSQNTVRFYLMNAGQKLRLIGKNRPII